MTCHQWSMKRTIFLNKAVSRKLGAIQKLGAIHSHLLKTPFADLLS